MENLWKNSAAVKDLRQSSLVQSPAYAENPLRFIVGGGDIDHSFYAGGELPHPVDCMQCGKPLVYMNREEPRTCAFCGDTGRANAVCEDGHFVCDACHTRDAGSKQPTGNASGRPAPTSGRPGNPLP